MTVVAFIPARGGSTRVPRKNLALVDGKTLLERTLRAAETCDRVVVSTDDTAIAAIARNRWHEVHERPEQLAGSTAQIEPAIAHWLRRADLAPTDTVVLLQPTSPFRRADTVRRCVDLVARGCDSALTVHHDPQRVHFSGRRRALYDEATGLDLCERVIWDRPLTWRPRSQDCAGDSVENGCVYAFTVAHFRATGCRMGGREGAVAISRWEAFEIDTPEDLAVARALAESGAVAL